eukprot:Skav224139  [mRNA]  locus=scaffold462:193386:197805:- [translate_table: standard]
MGDEVVAAAAFLRQRYPQLFFVVEQMKLESFLLRSCAVVGTGSEQGTALYRRGEGACYAALIISGEVKVFAGNEAHESIQGPWSFLGKRCLEMVLDKLEGKDVPKEARHDLQTKEAPRDRVEMCLNCYMAMWQTWRNNMPFP